MSAMSSNKANPQMFKAYTVSNLLYKDALRRKSKQKYVTDAKTS